MPDVIRAHWELARSITIVREVQSNHRLKQPAAGGSLGTVEGDITLEFYAIAQGKFPASIESNAPDEEAYGGL